MIDKTKTPILISTPRAGSHYVGQYIRETFKSKGILLPGSAELFGVVDDGRLDKDIQLRHIIKFFEETREVLHMDICAITHACHLNNRIRILSRPNYETLFDWFKEFYDGYQIVLLRRKDIWKQWLSYLFHKSIDIAADQSGETFTRKRYTEDVHPWHNIQGTMKEEILKSTIAALNPKFIHRENILQNFISEIRYMEEEVRNYYVKGSYNNNNVRDVWLEDLTDDVLTEWYIPQDMREDYVMNEKILPFKIKYATYFKKPDLEVAKNKFIKLYNDEFKHYGYLVD